MNSEQNEVSIREEDITLSPRNDSSHSQSFLRKILIVTIFVVVLLGITVGIVIVVNKKKEKPDEPIEPTQNTPLPEPIDETIIEPPKRTP